jgi:hypothetical protein
MLLVVIVELLRRRQMREKYTILWICVGVVAVLLGFFPDMLNKPAKLLGVASGVSLLLFLGILFLLLVSIHLSWEASRLEEKTRTLAEEIALANEKITKLMKSK